MTCGFAICPPLGRQCAAADLLRPATLTLYVEELDPRLAVPSGWRSDGPPRVLVRRKFWPDRASGHTCPTTATRDPDLALAVSSWLAYRALGAVFPEVRDTGDISCRRRWLAMAPRPPGTVMMLRSCVSGVNGELRLRWHRVGEHDVFKNRLRV